MVSPRADIFHHKKSLVGAEIPRLMPRQQQEHEDLKLYQLTSSGYHKKTTSAAAIGVFERNVHCIKIACNVCNLNYLFIIYKSSNQKSLITINILWIINKFILRGIVDTNFLTNIWCNYNSFSCVHYTVFDEDECEQTTRQ